MSVSFGLPPLIACTPFVSPKLGIFKHTRAGQPAKEDARLHGIFSSRHLHLSKCSIFVPPLFLLICLFNRLFNLASQINTAQAVAEQIMHMGYISRPYLGISFQVITPDIAAAYNLPVQWGVYISKVATNSPASQADLQRGDILTGIGGVSLDEIHSYINILFTYKPGDPVTVEFVRNGKAQQVQVTLGESNSGS